MLAGELPTEVALLEIDSLLPMIWGYKGRKHDDL